VVRAIFPAVWLAPRGIGLLLVLGVLLALTSVIPLAFGVLGVALAIGLALLIADAIVGPTSRSLRIEREPIGYLALRRPFVLRYRIENHTRGAITLGLLETPVSEIVFDREIVEATLGADSVGTLEQSALPRERGPIAFGPVYLWVENPIGLLRRRFVAGGSVAARVFPDLSAVEEYGSLARRSTLLDAGLRKLRQRGAGSEFESLRDYAAGDPFRAIDWKASARRGRLMVAQYDIERSQQILVLLDAGRLMVARIGLQRKFDYALTAALSIARIAQTTGDNIGLHAFAARPILSIAPRRGAAHVAALTQRVFDLQPRMEEPDYERTCSELRNRYSKRSLFILFTDMFDPIASAAVLGSLGLLVPRHLVMCVLMNDAAIAGALEHEPRAATDAYRASVAMTLLDERAKAIAQLRARGIIVIDVPAPQLTIALLDAYLDVKARALL